MLRRDYGFELEMSTATYCLAMTSMCDDFKQIDRLAEALCEISERIEHREEKKKSCDTVKIFQNKKNTVYTIYESSTIPSEKIEMEKACGRISAGYVYVYPPEIPIIVPGEEVCQQDIDVLKSYLEKGLNVKGIEDNNMISVHEKRC